MEPIFARYALRYAAQGFPVFPLRTGEKTPIYGGDCGKRNGSFHQATTDAGVIAYWATLHPAANIGLRTGEASGISVIDLDPQHYGFDTEASFRKEGKTLPGDCVVRSCRGGRHVYVKAHPLLATGTNRLGQGIDIRGDGAYIVLPPSQACGGKYSWLLKEWRGVPDAPDWVLQFLLGEKERKEREAAAKAAQFEANARKSQAELSDLERRRYEGFAHAAIDSEAVILSQCAKPGRNRALFEAACKLGKWQAHGIVSAREIAERLRGSCIANRLVQENGLDDVWKTIKAGFAKAAGDALPELADRTLSNIRRAA